MWEIFQTNVAKKIKKHTFYVQLPFSENRSIYEIMSKNIVEPDTPQMTTWRMRIACWITKATNTHSQYVIIITFPLQQWLHERTSMLRCTCIGCLSCLSLDAYLLRIPMFHCTCDVAQNAISWFTPTYEDTVNWYVIPTRCTSHRVFYLIW